MQQNNWAEDQQSLIALRQQLAYYSAIKAADNQDVIIYNVAKMLNSDYDKCQFCSDWCKPIQIHTGYEDDTDALSDVIITKLCGHCATTAFCFKDLEHCEVCSCFFLVENVEKAGTDFGLQKIPLGFPCCGYRRGYGSPLWCKYTPIADKPVAVHLPCELRSADDTKCGVIQNWYHNTMLQNWCCSACWKKVQQDRDDACVRLPLVECSFDHQFTVIPLESSYL